MKRDSKAKQPDQEAPILDMVTVEGLNTDKGFNMGCQHTCPSDQTAVLLLDVAQEIFLKSLCGEGIAFKPKRTSVAENVKQQVKIRYVHSDKGGHVRIIETSFASDLIALFTIQYCMSALQGNIDEANSSKLIIPGQGMPGMPGMSH